MSAAGLFGGPLGGAQETPKDAPPAPRAKRTTQVVTAPIAAVTVPAGTFISIIVDQGLTLDSPPGTPFEGHTETAFKVRNFTLTPAGMPVRGIAGGIGKGRGDFPNGVKIIYQTK